MRAPVDAERISIHGRGNRAAHLRTGPQDRDVNRAACAENDWARGDHDCRIRTGQLNHVARRRNDKTVYAAAMLVHRADPFPNSSCRL